MLIHAGSTGLVSTSPLRRCSASATTRVSSCFNSTMLASPLLERTYGGASLPDIDRIDVERMAHAARARQCIDLRQPFVDEAMQCGARGTLDQQLRVIAAGASRHGGR